MGEIQFDAQGRPYLMENGRQRFLPPIMAAEYAGLFSPEAGALAQSQLGADVIQRLRAYATANGVTPQNPAGAVPGGTFTRSRGEWNPDTGQYDTGMNMSGLGGAILGGTAVAAPFALGALLPSAPVSAAAGGAGAGTAAGAGAAAGGAMDAGAVIPGWGAPTAAGAGTGLARSLTNTLTSNIGPLAGIVSALAGGGGGGNPNLSADQQRIQQITEARMRRADPLHQMVVNLAASRMPTNMQMPIPQVKLPE